MKETPTSVGKGKFLALYCAAEAKAYTKSNIKSVWQVTGIVPYNPDSLLTQLPSYNPTDHRVPKDPTIPQSFKLLQCPKTEGIFDNRHLMRSVFWKQIQHSVVRQRSP
ncbi:hypothetical protein K440DRAFT_573188 [Wilcoxina mikolae CBS 423.85]|nr:hypothetical protein K440DRAFT_573188 [Wilcoxina mikolae CBS 423.85]